MSWRYLEEHKTGSVGPGLNIKEQLPYNLQFQQHMFPIKVKKNLWDSISLEDTWRCVLGISGITVYGTTVTKDTPRLYQFENYQTDPANIY